MQLFRRGIPALAIQMCYTETTKYEDHPLSRKTDRGVAEVVYTPDQLRLIWMQR
jgi:hypothetical protein